MQLYVRRRKRELTANSFFKKKIGIDGNRDLLFCSFLGAKYCIVNPFSAESPTAKLGCPGAGKQRLRVCKGELNELP